MKTKTKRRICVVIAFIAFFYILGIVGSVELFRINLKQFLIHLVFGFSVLAASLYKGGYLK